MQRTVGCQPPLLPVPGQHLPLHEAFPDFKHHSAVLIRLAVKTGFGEVLGGPFHQRLQLSVVGYLIQRT